MTKELKNIERIDGSTIESNLIERQLGFESPGDGLSQEHYKLKYKTRSNQVISFIPEGGEATFKKVNLTTVEDDNDAATKKYVDDKCEESKITTVRPRLTGFVSPEDVDLTYDVPNHHLFLKPKSGKSELQYYINGKLYTLKTTVDQVLDNSVVGHFYAFLNANGQIEYSQTWNDTLLPLMSGFRVSTNLGEAHTTVGDINNEYLSLIAAYNGTAMDKATREYQECNVGTWIEAGCSVAIADNKSTFGRSAGTLVHGDIATDLIGNDGVKPAIGYMADSLFAKHTIIPSNTNWLTEHGSSLHGSLYQGATKMERAPLGEGVWYLYFARPDMRSGLWSDIIIPVEGHSSFQNRYKGIDATVRNVASKYIDFIGEWKVMGLLFLQNDSIADFIDLAAFQVKDLLFCGMLERTLTTIEDDQNLSEVLARGNDAGGQDIVGVGKVGIGTDSPATSLHISQADLGTGWLGTPSQLSVSATDAQIDLVSTESASWGSGIQFKQVDTATRSYDDVWGIRRKTTKNGLGDGSLNVTYGEDPNAHINPTVARFHTDGSCELPLAENAIIDARGEKAVTTKKYVDAKYDSKLDIDGSTLVEIVPAGDGTMDKWYKIAEFIRTNPYANFNTTWEIMGRDTTPFELNVAVDGGTDYYRHPKLRITCKYSQVQLSGLIFKLQIADSLGSKFSLYVKRSGTDWNRIKRIIKQNVTSGFTVSYMREDVGITEPTGHEVLTASISENFEMLPESQDLSDVLSRGNDAGGQDINNTGKITVSDNDVYIKGTTNGGTRKLYIENKNSGGGRTDKSLGVNGDGEVVLRNESAAKDWMKIDALGAMTLPEVDINEIDTAGDKAVTTKEYVDGKLKNSSVSIPKTSLQAGQEYFIAYAKGGSTTSDYQIYSGDIDITFSLETNSHHNQVNLRVTKVLNEFIAKTTNQIWYASGNGKHCLGQLRIYKSTEWHGSMLISIVPSDTGLYIPVFEGAYSTTKPNLWTAITPTTTRPVEASNATILAMDLQSKSGYSVFNSNKSNSSFIDNNGTLELPETDISDIESANLKVVPTKEWVISKSFTKDLNDRLLRLDAVNIATLTGSNFYYLYNCSGTPSGVTNHGYLIQYELTEGNIYQRYIPYDSDRVFFRRKESGVWKGWLEEHSANSTLEEVLTTGNDAGGQNIKNVGDIDNAGYSFIGDTDTGLSKAVWSGTSVFGKNGLPKVVIGHLNQPDPQVNGAVVGAHTSGLNAWDQLTFGATSYRFFNGLNKQVMSLSDSGVLSLPDADNASIDTSDGKAVTTKEYNDANYFRAKHANSYWGLETPTGDGDWIRTTQLGLIPYQGGGASTVGTPSWPFNQMHSKTIFENGVTLSKRYAGVSPFDLNSCSVNLGFNSISNSTIIAPKTITGAPISVNNASTDETLTFAIPNVAEVEQRTIYIDSIGRMKNSQVGSETTLRLRRTGSSTHRVQVYIKELINNTDDYLNIELGPGIDLYWERCADNIGFMTNLESGNWQEWWSRTPHIEKGNFKATSHGWATEQDIYIKWEKHGNVVTLRMPTNSNGFAGIGSDPNRGFSGLPSNLIPNNRTICTGVLFTGNGSQNSMVYAEVQPSSGFVGFVTPSSNTPFTVSEGISIGYRSETLTYLLD